MSHENLKNFVSGSREKQDGEAKGNRPEPYDTGHSPIKFVNGEFVCFERGIVKPQFEVGSQEYQRNLFIEYERTFGRGRAFDLTHDLGGANYVPGTDSEKKFHEKYGSNLKEEYQEFSGRIRSFLSRGTKEDCEEMINELSEFRKRHPGLYSDVATKDPSVPKKKFEIKKD